MKTIWVKSVLVLATLAIAPLSALADTPREEATSRATKPAIAHDLQHKRQHARHHQHTRGQHQQQH